MDKSRRRLAIRGAIFEVARENRSWVRMPSSDTGPADLTPMTSRLTFPLSLSVFIIFICGYSSFRVPGEGEYREEFLAAYARAPAPGSQPGAQARRQPSNGLSHHHERMQRFGTKWQLLGDGFCAMLALTESVE